MGVFTPGEIGGRERGTYVQNRLWDERDEVRGLVGKNAMFYVCGSRAVADGAGRVMKKMPMEWQDGCCGVEEAERWFQDSKGRTYMADILDSCKIVASRIINSEGPFIDSLEPL